MKFFIVVIIALSATGTFAKSRAEKEAEKTESRNAKAICLMKDNLMRGERLKDCMKAEIEKNRRSDLKAENRALRTP